jgi:hypothetical protein
VGPFSRCRPGSPSAKTWSWLRKTQLAAARYRARFVGVLYCRTVGRCGTARTESWTIGADSLAVLISSASQSPVVIATGPCDADVDKGRRTKVFDTAVVTGARAEIVEESFAATQQDRHYRNMHLIDERSTQVLPDRGCTTSDEDITVTGRLEGSIEGYFNPAVNEIKGCSPCISRGTRGSWVSTNTG